MDRLQNEVTGGRDDRHSVEGVVKMRCGQQDDDHQRVYVP